MTKLSPIARLHAQLRFGCNVYPFVRTSWFVHCDVIMAKHCLHQCVLASIPCTKPFQIQRLVVPSFVSIPRAGVVRIRGQGRWLRDCCHAHEFCSGHGFKFTTLKHVVGWDGSVVVKWFVFAMRCHYDFKVVYFLLCLKLFCCIVHSKWWLYGCCAVKDWHKGYRTQRGLFNAVCQMM